MNISIYFFESRNGVQDILAVEHTEMSKDEIELLIESAKVGKVIIENQSFTLSDTYFELMSGEEGFSEYERFRFVLELAKET